MSDSSRPFSKSLEGNTVCIIIVGKRFKLAHAHHLTGAWSKFMAEEILCTLFLFIFHFDISHFVHYINREIPLSVGIVTGFVYCKHVRKLAKFNLKFVLSAFSPTSITICLIYTYVYPNILFIIQISWINQLTSLRITPRT